MAELHALCGIRIGELLKIKVSDVSGRNLILRKAKSGKESEVAFMPDRYPGGCGAISGRVISVRGPDINDLYSTTRELGKKLGAELTVALTPNDLRRYSPTYASRNHEWGAPGDNLHDHPRLHD